MVYQFSSHKPTKLPTSDMASTLGSYAVWMEVLSSQTENRLDA